MWLYRAGLRRDFSDPERLVGYEVEGIDGTVGTLDRVSTQTIRQFLVIHRDRQSFGGQRIIAAGDVTFVDRENHKIYVEMTRGEVDRAPRDEKSITGGDGLCYEQESWFTLQG